MRITKIDYYRIFVPWRESYREAMVYWRGLAGTTPEEEDAFVVIRMHTDEGIVGIGEGGRSIQAAKDYGDRLIGRNPMEMDPFNLSPPWSHALLDIAGKALDVPACRILGGKHRDRVPFAFWSPYQPPERTARHAEEGARAGFKVHKIKARPWDVVEQVKLITSAGGPGYAVRVDPNELFELPSTTLGIDRELAGYDVECLEDPVPKARPEWYSLLRKKCVAPLTIHTTDLRVIMQMARADGMDYVNVGRSPNVARAAASAADAAGCPVWVQVEGHCLDIVAAFTVHLAASIPNATLPAGMYVFLRDGHIAQEPIEIVDAAGIVPERPGLGIELDDGLVENYRVG